MTDQRELRRRFLRIEVVTTRDRHRHVRLPGAEPHLAHEHILYLDLAAFFAGHEQRPRFFTRSERIELQRPFAIRRGDGRLRLPGEGNRYRFPRIRPAPHGDGFVALQDHVLRENGSQFQFSRV
jgi:hypothetical protein